MTVASFEKVTFGDRLPFFLAARRTQTIDAPVAVGIVAIGIAFSETIRHARGSLKAADHGDNVDLSSRKIFFGIVVSGWFTGFAAGAIRFWDFRNRRSGLIYHRWLFGCRAKGQGVKKRTVLA